MDILLCILSKMEKITAKDINKYIHRNNMICEKVETENMNYTYTKSCCNEKQRNGAIPGYLIDVNGRFKILYTKK